MISQALKKVIRYFASTYQIVKRQDEMEIALDRHIDATRDRFESHEKATDIRFDGLEQSVAAITAELAGGRDRDIQILTGQSMIVQQIGGLQSHNAALGVRLEGLYEKIDSFLKMSDEVRKLSDSVIEIKTSLNMNRRQSDRT